MLFHSVALEIVPMESDLSQRGLFIQTGKSPSGPVAASSRAGATVAPSFRRSNCRPLLSESFAQFLPEFDVSSLR